MELKHIDRRAWFRCDYVQYEPAETAIIATILYGVEHSNTG